MSKMRKRFLPVLLAASMVCGSVSPAYAADLFSAGEEDIAAESVEFTDESAVEGQGLLPDWMKPDPEKTEENAWKFATASINLVPGVNFTVDQVKNIAKLLGINDISKDGDKLIDLVKNIITVINSKDPKKIIEFIVGLAKDSVDNSIKVPVTVNYIEDETTLDNKGKVEIPFTEVVDALQNGVSRDTIEADLNTTNSGYEIVGEAASFKIEPTTDLQLNLGSLANDLKNLLDSIQNGTLPFSLSVNVPVQEKEIPNITVTVTFKDLLGKVYDKLAGKTFEVAPETTKITANELTAKGIIPKNYRITRLQKEFYISENMDVVIVPTTDYLISLFEDWVDVLVKKDQLSVNVHFQNEGKDIAEPSSKKISLEKLFTGTLSKSDVEGFVDTSKWVITENNFRIALNLNIFKDMNLNIFKDVLYVNVPVAPTTRDVTIKFVDKDGNEIEGVSDATVEDVLSIKTTLTTDEVTAELPEGYLLCAEQEFTIDENNLVTVKIEPEIKTVRVHVFYMDKVGDTIKDEVELDIEENENKLIPEEKLAIPAGYMLAEDASLKYTEDVYHITKLDFYAKIKIVPAKKDVAIKFYNVNDVELTGGKFNNNKINVDADAKTVEKDTVKKCVPEHFQLCANQTFTIKENTISVKVELKNDDDAWKYVFDKTEKKDKVSVALHYMNGSDAVTPDGTTTLNRRNFLNKALKLRDVKAPSNKWIVDTSKSTTPIVVTPIGWERFDISANVPVKPAKRNMQAKFYEGNKLICTEERISVPVGEVTYDDFKDQISKKNIKTLEAYNVTKVEIKDGYIKVTLEKKTREITVKFTGKGINVKSVVVEVPNRNTVKYDDFKGQISNILKDYVVKDTNKTYRVESYKGTAYIEVELARKTPDYKTVNVKFVDKDNQNKTFNTVEMNQVPYSKNEIKFNELLTYLKDSQIPSGYRLYKTQDKFKITNKAITVLIETKMVDITVKYLVKGNNKPILKKEISVNRDASKIKKSVVESKLQESKPDYQLVEGMYRDEISFTNHTITVCVEKKAKEVKLVFYDINGRKLPTNYFPEKIVKVTDDNVKAVVAKAVKDLPGSWKVYMCSSISSNNIIKVSIRK